MVQVFYLLVKLRPHLRLLFRLLRLTGQDQSLKFRPLEV